MVRTSPLILLAALIAAGPPAVASALSCRAPSPILWPSADTSAPTNARVHVIFPDRRVPDWTIVLQPQLGEEASAEEAGTAGPVAVDVQRLEGAHRTVLVATPREHLAPRTTYLVSLQRGSEVRELGEVVTGEHAITGTPEWPGISEVIRRPAGLWVARHAILRLHEDPVEPDSAPGLRYAVWRLSDDSDDQAMPEGPPDALVHASEEQLIVGGQIWCTPPTLTLPQEGALRILVRPMDLAGNLGEAHIVVIPPADQETGR